VATKRKLRDLQADCDRLEAARATLWTELAQVDALKWAAWQAHDDDAAGRYMAQLDDLRRELAGVNAQLVAAQAARDQAVVDPERPLLES
jgi:multidrug resistance efflux pump